MIGTPQAPSLPTGVLGLSISITLHRSHSHCPRIFRQDLQTRRQPETHLPARRQVVSLTPQAGLILSPIVRFALVPDRKNQRSVLILLEAIKGHVASLSARYHQFSKWILHRTTDERMADEEFNGFRYQSNDLCCEGRIGLHQEVG